MKALTWNKFYALLLISSLLTHAYTLSYLMQTCKWTHMTKSEIFLPLRRLEVWFLCNVGTQEWYTEERVKSGSLARLPLGLWGVTKRGSTAFVEGNSQAPLGHSQPALWTPEGCLIINTCKQNSPKRCFFFTNILAFWPKDSNTFSCICGSGGACTSTCWQSPTILSWLSALCLLGLCSGVPSPY